MSTRSARLGSALTATPAATVVLALRGREHHVQLKLESANRSGSIKDRTAVGLLLSMERHAPLLPGTVVVESTSGNLGLALAGLLGPMQCRLIAVIDPRTSPATHSALVAAGAEVVLVDRPDGHGGYLLSRLDTVRDLCRTHPGHRWSDQYGNAANPRIHRLTTGPEIAEQAHPGLDAVYVAVSTGGTLAGVSAHLRSTGRPIRIVAVDAPGSLVTGAPQGRRLIPGMGASRPSAFLARHSYDASRCVADAEAIAMCRMVLADTGLALGGSSGSVLHACLADLAGDHPPRHPLCLCPDGGDRYATTLYDDGWLAAVGEADRVRDAESRLRADGLRIRLVEPRARRREPQRQ
ncbi:pyridoxal-phosphate dependent enzyme [Modestobacter sp. Leaf380]|uniref:pyridoxal-phosphate dependent enzyme n=1 Tax=Modestobacter sp. Leaf380 TaxID=1736356 RepID=UPI0006F5EBDB|nr:pyridoxal-phosphate dependent enzyme [Modestobacter sp. Leaf380]KQS71312.1 hypothetical protein ASG41_20110 [Modestobacter sp. Leaf380]